MNLKVDCQVNQGKGTKTHEAKSQKCKTGKGRSRHKQSINGKRQDCGHKTGIGQITEINHMHLGNHLAQQTRLVKASQRSE